MSTTVQPINRTLTVETTVTTLECSECGVLFALGSHFMKKRREDHKWFYCPNGHSQHYPQKSEAERLRQQLKWAESSAQSWRDQAETAERRRRGEKAAKTRLKNRIANGVCPCCQRSFTDLQQHMATKHPDYANPEEGS